MVKIILKLPILLIAFFLIISCEDTTSYSAEDYLTKGWGKIEIGSYQSALENFDKAAAKDADPNQVALGRGWSYLGLGNKTAACNCFENFSNETDLTNEKITLKALYFFTDGNLEQLLNQTENFPENWQHSRLSEFRSKDIIIIRALAYFQANMYQNCINEIQKIEPDYSFDLTNIDSTEGYAKRTLLFEKIANL